VINNKQYQHYLSLLLILFLGIFLRFWQLDLKPLWMDEIITSIFSLGKNYSDVPLEVVLPVEDFLKIFTFNPGLSCNQIAENLANQSTHPPLFFCLMYGWLGWLRYLGHDWWVFQVRSLPAIFGIATIIAVYFLNRIAFSRKTGLMAAMVMAVSPFAVYLSQEARHYTLPMLLITLSLLGLLQIQQDIEKRQKLRLWVVLIWSIINAIGLYIHYFFILALAAEYITLIALMYVSKSKNKREIWQSIILSSVGIGISFLPWIMVMLNHSHRAETDWVPAPTHIAPLYQTFIGWLVMVIALPVENQSITITIICGLLMIFFGIWISKLIFQGLTLLWRSPPTHLPTFTLIIFSTSVILEFFALIYITGKDITVVPRYNFVYYPSFCALIAASLSETGLTQNVQGCRGEWYSPLRYHRGYKISVRKSCEREKNIEKTQRHNAKYITLLVGVISCIFVTSNLVFQKPFEPDKVAKNMNLQPQSPLVVVMAYRNNQDIALGLSFAASLKTERMHISKQYPTKFAFFQQSPDFQSVWQSLSQAKQLDNSIDKSNIWIIGPGRRRREYPQNIAIPTGKTCTIDESHHYRIGIPYQLYQCP
jgi:uncharacterized membrane protein